MNAERVLLENLPAIDAIVRQTCARRNFRPTDAEEFFSYVRLRFVENDYGILRKFEGRSQLRTYLVTVIQRLALDFQTALLGKWRPSAETQRMGQKAVTLETLIYRDHLTSEEAIQTLLHRYPDCDRKELDELISKLPVRSSGRPATVDLENCKEVPEDTKSDAFNRKDQEKKIRDLEVTIDSIISSLSHEERLVLKMKYFSGHTVAEIAPIVGIDPKKLYRLIERILQKIRKEIEIRNVMVPEIGSSEIAKYVHFSFEGEKHGGKK
jgi:RNA polymerase sigma factor (sigma-70 family)